MLLTDSRVLIKSWADWSSFSRGTGIWICSAGSKAAAGAGAAGSGDFEVKGFDDRDSGSRDFDARIGQQGESVDGLESLGNSESLALSIQLKLIKFDDIRVRLARVKVITADSAYARF